ncbi:MAG: response regulator [Clostridia bacterium]|nr:response regulator [Clostridia bacterium]
MVYNIIRYFMFLKASVKLEHSGRKHGLLTVPLLLLVFFLIGYLVIGITGVADLMMAAVLFGGSVFVFLLLVVIFSIISHVRETDQILSQRYDEMKAHLNAMTKHSMSAFLVNLSRDVIEDRRGEYLYATDYQYDTYSEMLKARGENVLDASYKAENSPFRREELLRLYHEGQTSVSETLFVRRRDGETGFVRLEALMTLMPVSSDVVAMITEYSYDEQIVRSALLEKIVMSEYDHVAYIVNGAYHLLISNGDKKSGLLLPENPRDTYESIYYNYMLPAFVRDKNDPAPNPLRFSQVEKALSQNDFYTVNAFFEIEGKQHYKRILFYCVDRVAGFYLMLISDSAKNEQEQAALNRPLPASAPGQPAGIKTDPAVRIPDPPAESAPAREESRLLKPLHILLVDDNEINREIGELMLVSEGWTVDQASDGREAVEKIASAAAGTYDLVLMDVQMPVMDGYAATSAIRALPDPAQASVPIIAVTANAFAEDVEKAKNAGMNSYVTKPISAEAIRRAALEALGE